MRVTVACPEALADKANKLASIIGKTVFDSNTYIEANFKDAGNNLYRVASFEARPEWVTQTQAAKAANSLSLPAWGDVNDLPDALAALSLLAIGNAVAAPSRIQAVINDNPQAAITTLNLTRI